MATKYWISTSSTTFSGAANWSTNTVPANSDEIVFNHLGTADCNAGFNTTLTGIILRKEKSYTGNIGLLSGTTATYFTLDGGTAYLEQETGSQSGSGSPLLMLDFGTTAGVCNIYDSSSTSANTYYPPILVKGTALTLHQGGGQVGVAVRPGETATGTFRVFAGSGSISPQLYLGPGSTVTAISANSGTISNRSDNTITAVTLDGNATYEYDGTGAHTTLSVYGDAKCKYAGTGIVTTLNLAGEFDRSEDTRTITLTTTNCYTGARFIADNGLAASTVRSTFNLVGTSIQDVTVELPVGEKL